jgi:hypothetical protein
MAGIFTPGTSEVLSGVYTCIKAAVALVALGARGVVAYPFTAKWGPINTLLEFDGAQDFLTTHYALGSGLSSDKIYKHAYAAKPRKLKGYRMATAAAAKGITTLNDAVAAKSLELETLYPSSRAFTMVVKDGTSGGKIVDLVENGVKLFTTEASTLADLETSLNTSNYVRVKTKGTLMPTNTAGTAFAGGNDGAVVTAVEYAAFLDAMEADGEANAFALDAVVDEAILTTALAWTKRVRDDGFYITFVRGGALAWDTALAGAHVVSKAANHNGVVNVGNGVDGYTAAEMALFIAARVASVALNATLTDEPIPYAVVNKKLKPVDRKLAKKSGTLIFVQEGSSILIDEGINTLTTPAAGQVKDFGKIRINNAIDSIAKDLEAFGTAYKRERSNTQEARETYAATVETEYLKPLQNMEVLQPGYFYRPDADYHGKAAIFHPAIDEAFFYSNITPVDSMEKIYQKIGVNF